MEELDKILNNWNTTSLEKGDKCYGLAKESQIGSMIQQKCLEYAVVNYENSKIDSRLCNLAHCYFLLARLYGVQTEEYYRRSIEYHIKGSKSKKYQFEDFYKFYSVDENSIDLVLRTIRLAKPSTFNDPTDCPIAQEGLANDIFPDKSVFDGLRIGCFGHVEGRYRAWEDSKKWAYYGNMHKGICIRYRFFNNILEDNFADKFVFKKVEYKEDFDFYRGIVADGFLRKTKSYDEEKEWRMVWYDRDYKHNPLYWSKDQNIYLPIGSEHISQVFVGCRCPETIVKTIIDYAKGKEPEIQVLKIIPDKDNVFKLTHMKV
jgi:hypothetical protein